MGADKLPPHRSLKGGVNDFTTGQPARRPGTDTVLFGSQITGTQDVVIPFPRTGDTYHITINGDVDRASLPPSLAAAAAREHALDAESALAQLSQVLTKARVKAGKPLLKTLARTIGYSESMLSRVFSGKLVPARDKLEALAEQLDVDTRTFATIWLPLWEAAMRKPVDRKPKTAVAQEPAARTISSPEALGHFVCPSCKAQVRLVDAPGHIEWHMSLGSAQFPTASVTHLRSV